MRHTHRGEPGSDPMRDLSLAPVVLALRADPTERELHGVGPALAAYRTQVAHRHMGSRRRKMFATVLGVKLGATLGGVAAGLAGVTTVVLISTNVPSGAPGTAGPPAPVQARPAVATSTPGATGTARSTATQRGPDADGPAKHGLCTAWKARSKHRDQGGANQSVAYQNLVKAAGGSAKLAAFCADVPAPGAAGNKGGNGVGRPSGKGTGKPTDKPSKSKAGEATDKEDDSATEPSETSEPTEQPGDDAKGTEDSSPTPGTAPSTGTSPHATTGTPVPPRATPAVPSPTTTP
ncbi:hypothetical protein [Terrabacter terrae]